MPMEMGLRLEHDGQTTGWTPDRPAAVPVSRSRYDRARPQSRPNTAATIPQPVVKAASRSRYDRGRDLPGLLPLWPSEIADDSPAGRHRIVQKLRRALRQERRRGLAGHWTYNLTRHAALLRAWQSETARLETREPRSE